MGRPLFGPKSRAARPALSGPSDTTGSCPHPSHCCLAVPGCPPGFLGGSCGGGGRSRLFQVAVQIHGHDHGSQLMGKERAEVRDVIRALVLLVPRLQDTPPEVSLLQQGLQDGSSTLVQSGYPAPPSSPPYLQASNSSCHTTHSGSVGPDVIQKLAETTLGGEGRVSRCTPPSFSTLRPLKQPPTFHTTPVQSCPSPSPRCRVLQRCHFRCRHSSTGERYGSS